MKLLFTNVSFQKTFDLTLERIYKWKGISTSITRSGMKELVLLYTKNVNFTFDDCAYLQNDVVAVGFPLGPVWAGIIMDTWKLKFVPRIRNYIVN